MSKAGNSDSESTVIEKNNYAHRQLMDLYRTEGNAFPCCTDELEYSSRKYSPSKGFVSGSAKSSLLRGISNESTEVMEDLQEKHGMVDVGRKRSRQSESDEDRLSDNFEKQGRSWLVKTTSDKPLTPGVRVTNASERASQNTRALLRDLVHFKKRAATLSDPNPRRHLYTKRIRNKWRNERQIKVLKTTHDICNGLQGQTTSCNSETCEYVVVPINKQAEIWRKETQESNDNLFQVRPRNKHPDSKKFKHKGARDPQTDENVLIPDTSAKLKVPRLRIRRVPTLRKFLQKGRIKQKSSAVTENVSKYHVLKKRRTFGNLKKQTSLSDGLKVLHSSKKGIYKKFVSSFCPEDIQKAPKILTRTVESRHDEPTKDASETSGINCITASGPNQHCLGKVISSQHPSLRKEYNSLSGRKWTQYRKLIDSSSHLEESDITWRKTTPPIKALPATVTVSEPLRNIQPLTPSIGATKEEAALLFVSNDENKHTFQPTQSTAVCNMAEHPTEIQNIVPTARSYPNAQIGNVGNHAQKPTQPQTNGSQMEIIQEGKSNSDLPSPYCLKQGCGSIASNVNYAIPITRDEKHVAKQFENLVTTQESLPLIPKNDLFSTTVFINDYIGDLTVPFDTCDNSIVTTSSPPKSSTLTSKAANETAKEVMVVKIDDNSSQDTEPIGIPDIVPGGNALPEDLVSLRQEFETQKKELETLFALWQHKENEEVVINQKTRDTLIKMTPLNQKGIEQCVQTSTGQNTNNKDNGKSPRIKTNMIPTTASANSCDVFQSANTARKLITNLDTSMSVRGTISDNVKTNATVKKKESYGGDQLKDSPGCRSLTMQLTEGNQKITTLTNPERLSVRQIHQQNNGDEIISKKNGIIKTAQNLQQASGSQENKDLSKRQSQSHTGVTSHESYTDENEPAFCKPRKCAMKIFPLSCDHERASIEPIHRSLAESKNKVQDTPGNATEGDIVAFYREPRTASESLFELEKLSNKHGKYLGGRSSIPFDDALNQGMVHPVYPFSQQRHMVRIERSIAKVPSTQTQQPQQLVFDGNMEMDTTLRHHQFVQDRQMINMSKGLQNSIGIEQNEHNLSRKLSESERSRKQQIQIKYAMEVELLQQRMRQIQKELIDLSGVKEVNTRKRNCPQKTRNEYSHLAQLPSKYSKASSSEKWPREHYITSNKTSRQECTPSPVALQTNMPTRELGSPERRVHTLQEETHNSFCPSGMYGSFQMVDCDSFQHHHVTSAQMDLYPRDVMITSIQSVDGHPVPIENTSQTSVTTPQHHTFHGPTMVIGEERPAFTSHCVQKLPSLSNAPISEPYHPWVRTHIQPSHHHCPRNPAMPISNQFTRPSKSATSANIPVVSCPPQGEMITNHRWSQAQMAVPNRMITVPNAHSNAGPIQTQPPIVAIRQDLRPEQMVPDPLVPQTHAQVQMLSMNRQLPSIQQYQTGAEGFGQQQSNSSYDIRPVLSEQTHRYKGPLSAHNITSFNQQRFAHHSSTIEDSLPRQYNIQYCHAHR